MDGIADFYFKIFFRAETLRKQNGDEPQHVNRASRSLLSVIRMVADNLHFLKAKERQSRIKHREHILHGH